MTKIKTLIEENTLKDELLELIISNKWSDLYITVWSYPAIKRWWSIMIIDKWYNKFTEDTTYEFALSLISESQHKILLEKKNLDFSFTFNKRRFRANISFQRWYYMVVLRLLTLEVPNIEILGLPKIYKEVCKKWQWLILVTWPTGSWKTTTLWAMIDFINSNYSKHIITIEDPIEYIHEHKNSIMEHKEIGRDLPDYTTWLIWAMRQNPDIILFWEMRNQEEIEMALRLSETWHLVLSTLHTRSAYQTITRILDSFQWEDKWQIRLQLADSLVAVFSQRLLESSNHESVVLAKEVLINNNAVSNLIREDELFQIPSVIQLWKNEWMQLLENDIISFIKEWSITKEEWMKYSNNPKLIEESI